MPTNNYKIIFKGEILPNVKVEIVKRRLTMILKLSEENIENLLKMKESILKENLTEEVALQFQQNLRDKIGIITYIENSEQQTSIDQESYTSDLNNALEKPQTETKIDSQQDENLNPPSKNSLNPIINDVPSENRKGTKLIWLLLTLILISTGGYFVYTNLYSTNKSQVSIPKAETSNIAPIATNNPSATNTDISPIKENKTIPQCSGESSSELIGKLLIEGFPAYIQKENNNLELNLNNIYVQNELYFDPQKNRRLCGLIAQYKVTNTESSEINNLAFEIIYEVYFDQEKKLNISTFKHTLLGTIKNKNDIDNIQSENPNQSDL